jgi:hypothetical protein
MLTLLPIPGDSGSILYFITLDRFCDITGSKCCISARCQRMLRSSHGYDIRMYDLIVHRNLIYFSIDGKGRHRR